MSDKEVSEQNKEKENIIVKGWNEFVSNITKGYNNFQKSIEESSKKNTELWNQNQEKINKFFEGAKENWNTTMKEWGTEIAKTQNENVDSWDVNLEKFNAFFENNQRSWENKIKEWSTDFEKRQTETKEQWEERKQKISEDIKNWQDKSKRDWEKGLKTFRREMMKGSYMFLLFMLPILVVFFVVVALITWLFNY
ncbi:MAG TPA: hypothetical protein VMV43_10370 [Candidatus Nanopelagicaceae bacterium]|nr:hypothetical protein [Candidatus Nanopelagicaceae bacterium]